MTTVTRETSAADEKAKLDELVRLYAMGNLSWVDLASSTGLAYGDVLIELGKRGLAVPRGVPNRRPAQDALFERALGGGQ